MLRREDIIMIKALHERGVYQKDIAEQLGVHPKPPGACACAAPGPGVAAAATLSEVEGERCRLEREVRRTRAVASRPPTFRAARAH